MEIYLINDEWSAAALDYYKKHGEVVLPVKGVPYTIREVIKGADTKFYLMVSEIKNQDEPAACFPYWIFSHVKPDGELVDVLPWEVVNEIYKSQLEQNDLKQPCNDTAK